MKARFSTDSLDALKDLGVLLCDISGAHSSQLKKLRDNVTAWLKPSETDQKDRLEKYREESQRQDDTLKVLLEKLGDMEGAVLDVSQKKLYT